MFALVPIFGVLAGILTTLAGLGGGILLLLLLSLFLGPSVALASTAPAMLFGNLHRWWLMRAEVDRPIAKAFSLGAVPGSFVGGLATAWMPALGLRLLMLFVTLAAVGRSYGLYTWKPPAKAMVVAGAGIGALSATAGGAGLLIGPLFMSAGLTGKRFVATIAVVAVALHTGRLAAYATGGLMTRETLLRGGVLTAAVMVGNLLGLRLRERFLNEKRAERLELGTLLVCAVLSLVGIGMG